MAFEAAWRKAVHKYFPSGVWVAQLGITLEIMVMHHFSQSHGLYKTHMWKQALFLFLPVLLMIAYWWPPGACWPNLHWLNKGSVWGKWCGFSPLWQLLWRILWMIWLLPSWTSFCLTKNMTSEKLQCCDSFASGKPQLLCLEDQLRLVGQHHAWETEQRTTDNELLEVESHQGPLLPTDTMTYQTKFQDPILINQIVTYGFQNLMTYQWLTITGCAKLWLKFQRISTELSLLDSTGSRCWKAQLDLHCLWLLHCGCSCGMQTPAWCLVAG